MHMFRAFLIFTFVWTKFAKAFFIPPPLKTNFSPAVYNTSSKGFATCYNSEDCTYGGLCISNRYGFNVIDDYQFQYRKPNKSRRNIAVVSDVMEGSPAWDAGIRSGYNIELDQPITE